MDEERLKRLLMKLAGEDGEDSDFKSQSQAEKHLDDYFDYTPDFKEGDPVERSDFGNKRYKLPGKNQAARCFKILDEPIKDEQGALCDALIICALRNGVVLTFPVDSRGYKKAQERKNIIPLWRKGKPN